MALFHLSNDALEPISQTTFGQLQMLERSDLQRLLKARLEIIAPDCMLLAEEFGEWTDGHRRIDLLAIDRDAKLVVIELKRTEDGGHLELQALRYAAMVSTMTFEQAIQAHTRYLTKMSVEEDARLRLVQFLGWEPADSEFATAVRLILVAAEFNREITTTVLWLNEHDLDIRCVRLRPHILDGRTILDVQQLIPIPEAADYQVRVREKNEQRRLSAAANSKDNTKFNLTIGNSIEEGLNKRRAVLRVISALVKSGVKPEQIAAVVPALTDRLFSGRSGSLSSTQFLEQVNDERVRSGRSFDEARWFCRDDELLHVDGRTYAIFNQWGTNTEQFLRDLTAAFPSAGIRVDTAE